MQLQEDASTSGLSLDEVADSCLLAGLLTLADKDLPIMTSDFYTKHMLPAKPPGDSQHGLHKASGHH